ncbi:unnamed protein product [Meganyctiphanes norvegica]|uniref:Aminopeptidase n=1 Tax=Meganyctiphanes norvegica TaxID=48144 RepID=A0AAV2QK18_MEGNR
MGETFVRRSTAAMLFLISVLAIVCVAMLVLLLAPDWRPNGSHGGGGPTDVEIVGSQVGSTTRPPRLTAGPTTPEPTEPWEKKYRIPRATLPHHYDLYLHPDLDTGEFTGRVRILVGVTQPMDYLVTHIKEMDILSTELVNEASGKSVELMDSFEYKPNQFWVLRPKTILQPGNYTINLSFKGPLDGHIVGFYRSVYTTKAGEKRSIATSKFQPTDARRAFPCFDEPSFKSTYKTTLVRPSQGYIALSNMPVEKETPNMPRGGLTEVEFQYSVPMVTYLACFIVCDFEYVETKTQDNKNFRVYATKDQINRTQYSRDIGVHILNYFEDYFEVDYPLPKQDMIAIPDFVSGAMEHWGLITYRETSLLYDDRGSSSYNKQRVASVVSHELAHMWFGNLVTLEWWDDLWLNEGFASYIEYKGVASYETDWDMESQFVVNDLQRVFTLDAQLSSHPIVQEVNHPDEITEIFDAISYSKGASVLRMLENFLGNEDFRLGVRNFLRNNKYGNAVTKDLWDELEKTSSEKVKVGDIMDTWTRQMGFPVLNIKTANSGKIEVRQERFLADPDAVSPNDSKYGYKWDVPVTFITNLNQNTKQLWLYRSMGKLLVDKPAGSTWIKFNADQRGYYRVNYDEQMWQELIAALKTDHEALAPADRAGLIDDAFALAQSGRLPYDTVLSLVSYMDKERHYLPWDVVTSHLSSMARLLRKTKAYSYLRKYIVNLVKPHYDRVGWEDTGSHLERRNRLNILALACSNGYDPCLNDAYNKLKLWTNDANYFIAPNIRSIAYTYGMRKAGINEWDVMLDRYVNEVNAQELSKLREGLANTKEDWIAQRWLLLAQNETLVRSQDYFSALSSLAAKPWHTHIIWDFVKNNWDALVERFSLNNRYLGRMVKSVTTRFTTEQQLKEVSSLLFYTFYSYHIKHSLIRSIYGLKFAHLLAGFSATFLP